MENTFGANLIKLRKENDLTRVQLAKNLDMSVNTLRNYETGEREPGHQFIVKVASYFNVTTDYLLGTGDGAQQKTSPPSEDEEEDIRDATRLYNALLNAGIIKENEVLSEKQLDFLMRLAEKSALLFDDDE